jgi:hypothetical protein
MNTDKELLALNAGSYNIFWFNSSGYLYYDASSGTGKCSFLTICDFNCEVYNYDSRFMDYVGTWKILSKNGTTPDSTKDYTIWVGNAIDAAGVFPSVMFVDSKKYFAGLDKLDPKPTKSGSIAYFYPTIRAVEPNFTAFAAGTIEGVGCASTLEQWMMSQSVLTQITSLFIVGSALIYSLM